MNQPRSARTTAVLVLILAVYVAGRILEVASGSPRTWIVAIEVLSALAFALVDGALHYGWRGILVFAAICAVIGNVVENVGVLTGVPFGHYNFLALMGPRIFYVPVLLGLAYIGMAYVSWMIARLIVGRHGGRLFVLPAVASFIMVAWDWAQDPVWSTLLHAWRWGDGGSWFGVPVSNYVGWYLNVFLIYLLFWLYLRRTPPALAFGRAPDWPPVLFYALCAAGNALQVFTRLPQQTVMDATGKPWSVAAILAASALVSIFAMGGFVLAAWWRLGRGSEARAILTTSEG
jgi:uncharacterized membrane protein